MTTIAYKNGIMAADSLATTGTLKLSTASVQKVYIMGESDGLLGICGDAWEKLYQPDILEQITEPDHIQAFCDLGAKMRYEMAAIAVFRNDPSTVYMIEIVRTDDITEGGYFTLTLDEDTGLALGSGSRYAMGAMSVGASAEDALEAACEFDPFTGGDVIWFELND